VHGPRVGALVLQPKPLTEHDAFDPAGGGSVIARRTLSATDVVQRHELVHAAKFLRSGTATSPDRPQTADKLSCVTGPNRVGIITTEVVP
jgi:hypothetical protein